MQIFNNTYMNFTWIVLDTRVILFIIPHPTPPPLPPKKTPQKQIKQKINNKPTKQIRINSIKFMIEFKK